MPSLGTFIWFSLPFLGFALVDSLRVRCSLALSSRFPDTEVFRNADVIAAAWGLADCGLVNSQPLIIMEDHMDVGSERNPIKKARWRMIVEAGLNAFAWRLLAIFLILVILFIFSWIRLRVGAH